MNYKIKKGSEISLRALLGALVGLGYKFSDYFEDVERYLRKSTYPYVLITESGIIDACRENYTEAEIILWPEGFEEIISVALIKSIYIENVGKYKAKITAKGIKVGCTSISFEKFNEIAEAVKSFQQ